ncbi:MAG TPA: NAD(P)-binding domain-containing protein [Candidatus Limnocylindria bacterium]|nr:NAD(P)-binding domain-containing protein [Candidatus Limnocylindria bacterium]
MTAHDSDFRRIQAASRSASPPSGVGALFVIAATFREAGTEERERAAAALELLAAELPEHVLLRTCHRVELVGIARSSTHSRPAATREVHGVEAAERVFLVAGGLDSAVVAEEQLLGQVRGAYETALGACHSGPLLNELFRRAIRFGRRVRSHAAPGGDRSLADRAARWAIANLADPVRGRALVLGTGEMGRILAARFLDAGMAVTVASGRAERAQRLALELERVSGRKPAAASRQEALAAVGQFDVVAVAVRGGRSLLDALGLGHARPLIVDLSSPPALAPGLRASLAGRVCDLDSLAAADATSPLGARESAFRAEARAEALAFAEWAEQRAATGAVARLHARAAGVKERHVARLAREARYDAGQLAAIDAMATAMLNELLHEPTVRLRRRGEAADAVVELFGLGA